MGPKPRWPSKPPHSRVQPKRAIPGSKRPIGFIAKAPWPIHRALVHAVAESLRARCAGVEHCERYILSHERQGASTSDRGPNRAATLPEPLPVSLRPAHTGSSLEPHDNAVLCRSTKSSGNQVTRAGPGPEGCRFGPWVCSGPGGQPTCLAQTQRRQLQKVHRTGVCLA